MHVTTHAATCPEHGFHRRLMLQHRQVLDAVRLIAPELGGPGMAADGYAFCAASLADAGLPDLAADALLASAAAAMQRLDVEGAVQLIKVSADHQAGPGGFLRKKTTHVSST
jgi:hypothetical protein